MSDEATASHPMPVNHRPGEVTVSDDIDSNGAVPRQRLVDSKARWAREGRHLTGTSGDPARDRLPPGQKQVRNWPVLDLGIQPRIPLESWTLRVDGLVE